MLIRGVSPAGGSSSLGKTPKLCGSDPPKNSPLTNVISVQPSYVFMDSHFSAFMVTFTHTL